MTLPASRAENALEIAEPATMRWSHAARQAAKCGPKRMFQCKPPTNTPFADHWLKSAPASFTSRRWRASCNGSGFFAPSAGTALRPVARRSTPAPPARPIPGLCAPVGARRRRSRRNGSKKHQPYLRGHSQSLRCRGARITRCQKLHQGREYGYAWR